MCYQCEIRRMQVTTENYGEVVQDATEAALSAVQHLVRGWDLAARSLARDIDQRWGPYGMHNLLWVWSVMVSYLPPHPHSDPLTGEDQLRRVLEDRYGAPVTDDQLADAQAAEREALRIAHQLASLTENPEQFTSVMFSITDAQVSDNVETCLLVIAAERVEHAFDSGMTGQLDQMTARIRDGLPHGCTDALQENDTED